MTETPEGVGGADPIPCPFCGGPVVAQPVHGGYPWEDYLPWEDLYHMGKDCAMFGERDLLTSGAAGTATARWNTRALPTPPEEP